MTNALLSDGLISGYRAVDDEHHLQLSLLAAVQHAVAEGQAVEEVDELFDRFVDFTKVHFASEATLMRLYQYSHFDAHVLDHEHTLEQLAAIQFDWRAGRVISSFDGMGVLADWIQDHISTADRAFGRYLVRLGVGPG